MFCRYCGKQIENDSDYCKYCGKVQTQTVTSEHSNNNSDVSPQDSLLSNGEKKGKVKEKNKKANYALQDATKVLCYIALAVFLFFNFKMAPMYGVMKIVCYFIVAGIAITLVVFINKTVFDRESKREYLLCLSAAISVIILSIGLRIVYEAKVDYVKNQIPSSGEVLVSISEKTKYYNSSGTGSIKNPKTYITIGEESNRKLYENRSVVPIKLDKTYPLQVIAGGSRGKIPHMILLVSVKMN